MYKWVESKKGENVKLKVFPLIADLLSNRYARVSITFEETLLGDKEVEVQWSWKSICFSLTTRLLFYLLTLFFDCRTSQLIIRV